MPLSKAKSRVVAGIDEAGRGPVLGPMILSLVAMPYDALGSLAKAGVRDSKELTAEERERLFSIILSESVYMIYIVIPPSIIDMFNINEIEYDVIRYMLERLYHVLGAPDAVVIDAVGPPRKLRSFLASSLNWLGGSQLIIEARADSKYTVVSAASIIAKVIRDREVKKLHELYGVKGSGYPADEDTIEWLKEEYKRNPDNPPRFIRRTWATLRTIAPKWYIEKKPRSLTQRSLLEFLGQREHT